MPPKFLHYDKIQEFKRNLFRLWITTDESFIEFILASILIPNNRVLFVGLPGSGKTTLVRLIARGLSKGYSEPILGITTGAPEKTFQKVIVSTNIVKLLREGIEEYIPRPIIKARIKFINEINRFSKSVQDAFLSLLEEGYIEYGGTTFRTPPYICFADMNPFRGDLERALKSRFLGSAYVELPSLSESLEIMENIFALKHSYTKSSNLIEAMPKIISFDELENIWVDIENIQIPFETRLLASMIISAFRVCKYPKVRIMPGYFRTPCVDCEYSNEPCSKIQEPPDERALISLIFYARARAWLHHRESIIYDDLFWAIPYTLGHRIEFKPNIKSKIYNPWDYLKEIAEYLYQSKLGSPENPGIWLKSIAATCVVLKRQCSLSLVNEFSSQSEALNELQRLGFGHLSRGDLVVRELYKHVQRTLSKS